MWIRYARIYVTWRCISNDGYESKPHLVKVKIEDRYKKKPTEDISIWISRVGTIVASIMCRTACQSLSSSVSCLELSTESEVIYTSEMLV